jgi:hypothetical protein
MRRCADGRYWWHLSWAEFAAGYRRAARLPILDILADIHMLPGSRFADGLKQASAAAWHTTD